MVTSTDIDARAHRRGFALTLFGVLVLTPDTLMIRLIDIDPWTMNFWRGAMMAATLILAYAGVRRGALFADIRGLGIAGLAVAVIYALNAISFVFAVEHTRVANVLIILAATPLISALLSVIVLKERVAGPTWAAIAAGMTGVIIVVGDGFRAGTSLGDIFAFVTATALAVTFIIIRHNRHVNMIPAAALGALLSAVLVSPLADPMSVPAESWGLLLVLGFVVMPVSFGLITLGPRTLPAPEVALLMLLETVLGPLWVWLVIDEAPSETTFIGGVVVIGAVAMQSAWRLRRTAKPA
ncbi:MAG: DMT family transporter [Rhodospirillales bacterium]|nr:DMT family transporter [Rhodospirillales bacterium]MBO6788308.1 DMT family transporter [Rhodospirillales bacterium]